MILYNAIAQRPSESTTNDRVKCSKGNEAMGQLEKQNKTQLRKSTKTGKGAAGRTGCLQVRGKQEVTTREMVHPCDKLSTKVLVIKGVFMSEQNDQH